ncbi:uncharacterized protein RHO25_005145 [Cercospora beticola]|uniref:Multiple myeloma tumor-associated protein 2-like N-terminal domain-containing protein n=1 Tax=Cercospora beticola TaxID=122368 RepID=A0ABZ0NM17_CERBT|nr:hypothetical protein RHO25_005145 [Cercospora beticola]
MDLLQTVRKEGSRGGVNFSWDDVKNATNRENYLGHSLMAPVGRWQKNKDLNWYAKADDAELTPDERAEREREAKCEEMRKVKEAEEDAMNLALGLPVPDRSNANLQPLGESKISQREVNKALREALGDGEEDEGAKSSLGSREKKEHRSREHRRRARSRSTGSRDQGHEKAIESLGGTGISRDQGPEKEGIETEVKTEKNTAATDTEIAAVTEMKTGTGGGKSATGGHEVAVESVRMTAAVHHMNEDDDEMIHDE